MVGPLLVMYGVTSPTNGRKWMGHWGEISPLFSWSCNTIVTGSGGLPCRIPRYSSLFRWKSIPGSFDFLGISPWSCEKKNLPEVFGLTTWEMISIGRKRWSLACCVFVLSVFLLLGSEIDTMPPRTTGFSSASSFWKSFDKLTLL